MTEKKNGVLFIIFSLGNGGTERMMMNVLNKCELPHNDKILYLYSYIDNNSYEKLLNSNITIYKHPRTQKKYKHFVQISKLIKIIKNHNVETIVCFSSKSALLAVIIKKIFFFKKIKVISRLGAFFLKQYSDTKNMIKYHFWTHVTLHFSYRYSDKVICLTNAMKNDLVSKSEKLFDKIVIINNYIDTDRIELALKNPLPVKYQNYFIAVGRLEKQKNYFGLIEAFNIIKDEIKENLLILGDGGHKTILEDYINQIQCSNRIKLLGFKENPYKYISNANFYILNSYFEGMSNSLLEAMICKIPIIVTNHPGVEDVITNEKNGLIVPMGDDATLAKTIVRLSNDKELQSNLAKASFKSAVRFTNTIEKYSELIDELRDNK